MNHCMRRLKPGSRSTMLGLERLHREERDQADHRADLQREWAGAAGQVEHVVVEAVLVVPEADPLAAEVVHGVRDVDEVLEELARHVLVGRVLAGQLQRDGQHVQRVHGHPARAVGLLDMPAGGQRRRAVEHPDIVEAEEAALEDVLALGVLAVDPPGEVEEQLVEDALQELRGRPARDLPVDLVDAPGRPRVHGRVDVARTPTHRRGSGRWGACTTRAGSRTAGTWRSRGRRRASGMQWKARSQAANQGYSHLSGMEMHVVVVQVLPVVVAALGAARGAAAGWVGIAASQRLDIVVIELLAPEQPASAWRITAPAVARSARGISRRRSRRPRRGGRRRPASKSRAERAGGGAAAASRSRTLTLAPRGRRQTVVGAPPWCRSPPD